MPSPTSGEKPHQSLNLEALSISQLTARHISRACAKSDSTEESDEKGIGANRSPATAVEDLQAAVLRTAVSCEDTVSQAHITLRCTDLTSYVKMRLNIPSGVQQDIPILL